jgi:hypothetical protein
MCSQWMNLSYKTGKSTSVKLLACREFNLGHFRAFWKTTLKCVWLLLTSHPALWVRSIKRIMWTHGGLSRGAWKRPSIPFKDIAGGETWVYGYDPGTKQQSSQFNSPSALNPKLQGKFTQIGRASICFLWHSQSCALWICSTRADCKPALLTRHLTVSGRKHVVKTTWKMEFRAMGFSIMNMHLLILLCMCKTFWLITKWLSLHTLHDLAPCDFSLFTELKMVL